MLLGALAFFLSVLGLDFSSFGQIMVSRPLVFAPVVGCLFGRPETGMGLGLAYEFFSLERMPIGGDSWFDAAAAAGAALLLVLGPGGVPVSLAFPAGLLAGFLRREEEVWLRRRRGALSSAAERRLAAGEDQSLGLLAAREIFLDFLATWAVLAAVLAVKPLIALASGALPAGIGSALDFSYFASLWIGAACLLRSFHLLR